LTGAIRSWRQVFEKSLDMQKAQLLQLIIASLSDSLALLEKAARASHAEATHEGSKAESKYDTRGLEAAYLAGGQARQAKEIMDSIGLSPVKEVANNALMSGDRVCMTRTNPSIFVAGSDTVPVSGYRCIPASRFQFTVGCPSILFRPLPPGRPRIWLVRGPRRR